jgi:DNA-binding SARP family transcriptional activator
LHQKNEYEKALQQFQKAANLDPYFTAALEEIANIYYENNQQDKAL